MCCVAGRRPATLLHKHGQNCGYGTKAGLSRPGQSRTGSSGKRDRLKWDLAKGGLAGLINSLLHMLRWMPGTLLVSDSLSSSLIQWNLLPEPAVSSLINRRLVCRPLRPRTRFNPHAHPPHHCLPDQTPIRWTLCAPALLVPPTTSRTSEVGVNPDALVNENSAPLSNCVGCGSYSSINVTRAATSLPLIGRMKESSSEDTSICATPCELSTCNLLV